jgi:hypothetical protein
MDALAPLAGLVVIQLEDPTKVEKPVPSSPGGMGVSVAEFEDRHHPRCAMRYAAAAPRS